MATGNTTGTPRQLSQKEADIQIMLAAEVHLGTKNCNFQMERYVFKRRNDGNTLLFSILLHSISMILGLTWLKYSAMRGKLRFFFLLCVN